MRPEALNLWLSRDPFVPFRISLSNGRTFDIYDPHTVIFWDRTTIFIGDLDPDFPFPVLSKSTTVPLVHINAVSPLPQPTSAA